MIKRCTRCRAHMRLSSVYMNGTYYKEWFCSECTQALMPTGEELHEQ